MTPKIQFDFSAIDPRHRAVIIGGLIVIATTITSLVILLPPGEEAAGIEEGPTTTLSSPSPYPTPSQAGPPTETPTQAPTATLAPYEYTVQPGDTLYYIIQLFGYRDTSVVPEIIVLNGMANENDLVAGQTLLIPRQTPTPGPTNTPSPTVDPLLTTSPMPPTTTPGPTQDLNVTITYSGCTPDSRCASPDGQYWIHIVQEGDTVAGIAYAYDSTISCILRENGLPANPLIVVGQQIRVCILVTLTPTLTPTGGPDSTATPTPLPSAPSLLAPAQEAILPRSTSVVLQWVAARSLSEGEWYLVVVRNTISGEEIRATTRSNSYRLPPELQPGPGRSVQYEWRVLIVGGSSPDSPVLSPPGETRTFTWGQ